MHCKKCEIWFCFHCGLCLIQAGYELPLRCPMCGEEIE
jgi:hypothetical protein